MDLAGFVESFHCVIVQRGAFVEMNCDRVLPSVHLNDRGRGPEELGVVREVLHAKSSRHDQQLHGYIFLQRGGSNQRREDEMRSGEICHLNRL